LPSSHMLRFLLVALLAAIAAADTELYQSDFEHGTYRILEPGRYVLAEDISFDPNNNGPTPYDSCHVEEYQYESNGGTYGDREFGLMFFAVITVEADDVEIDLNGHTIEQSANHALLQRFLAVIELANSPFLSSQGPHTFTTPGRFKAAQNVRIHGGTIGRSSHHGIHGNDNRNVVIENVDFVDFEVAGVALNGVEGLDMRDCTMVNRKDLPVLGTFSAGRFLHHQLHHLVMSNSQTTLRVQGTELSASDIETALRDAMNNAAYDIMATGAIHVAAHPDEYALFANKHRVIDGNAYGLLLNKIGVAVNGFPRRPGAPTFEKMSTDVTIRNVEINDIDSVVTEVVAIKIAGKAVTDSTGAILQLLNRHPDTNQLVSISSEDESQAEYIGNPVANAQIFIAKAVLNGDFDGSTFDHSRNSIRQPLIDWVEAGGSGSPTAKLSDLAIEGWQCNGDSMAHVQKGSIGFKIDASKNVRIADSYVNGLQNRGATGSPKCGVYEKSHPMAELPYYNGAHVRGFSFAGSEGVQLQRCSVINARSIHGNAIGFDVFTDSVDVDLFNCEVVILDSENEYATAFHLGGETTYSNLQNYCAAYVTGQKGSVDVWDEDGIRNTIRNKRC